MLHVRICINEVESTTLVSNNGNATLDEILGRPRIRYQDYNELYIQKPIEGRLIKSSTVIQPSNSLLVLKLQLVNLGHFHLCLC